MDCAGRWRWTSLHIDVSHLESCFFKYILHKKFIMIDNCTREFKIYIVFKKILSPSQQYNMLKRETKFTKLENKHRYVLHFTSLAIPNVNYNM